VSQHDVMYLQKNV